MQELAVVPIFVNAGAAVLPAIIGAAVSAVALLFKPRELFRLFRRRPIIPAVLVALVALIVVSVRWLNADSGVETAKPSAAAAQPFDWGDVGRRLVTARKLAARNGTTQPVAASAGEVMLGRDVARSAFDGGRTPLGLEDLWSYADGDTLFLSTPAVRDGRVYAAACQLDIVGKFGYVVALDARTGKQLWKTTGPTPEEPFAAFFSSPAITQDGKWLIIGQGLHDSADCSLICLDAATGAIKWLVKTPLHLESSPAVRGDLAVIGAGAIEDANHKPTGDPGFVMAVQISTGKELWRHAVNDPESSPAIGDDGTVYIGAGFNGNAVVALRCEPDAELKAKGLAREIWRTKSPYPVTGAITLAGDRVIVGAGNCDFVNVDPRPAGMVMALDRRTGSVAWKMEMGDSVLGYVSYRDGRIACPVRNGDVAMLDAAGHQLWRTKVSGGTPVLAGCAFTGTHVYVVTKDGRLAVLDAASGAVIERVMTNDKAKPGESGYALSAPTIANGNVYIGSETGGVRCFAGTK